MQLAFNYLKKHDAMLESQYKYTAEDGDCLYKEGTGIRVSESFRVPSEDVAAMKAAVSR